MHFTSASIHIHKLWDHYSCIILKDYVIGVTYERDWAFSVTRTGLWIKKELGF